jgi:hypothetical protein
VEGNRAPGGAAAIVGASTGTGVGPAAGPYAWTETGATRDWGRAAATPVAGPGAGIGGGTDAQEEDEAAGAAGVDNQVGLEASPTASQGNINHGQNHKLHSP